MLTRYCCLSAFLAAFLPLTLKANPADYLPPALVKVQPVFYVPKGEQPPSEEQSANFLWHLVWTQTRYKELLQDRDTFTLADGRPQVFMAEQDLAFYRQSPGGGANQFVLDLLERDKCNRYNCPNIYVVVLMNPIDDYPGGGGRPINGGFNTGGGIVILSSHGLDQTACFQSTLQHELGHAFGLPHVDVYGYDMLANPSLMSYNPAHHTQGFQPSQTPGAFIAEDVRGLALNHRAFPKLKYDPAKDCPPGYPIAKRIVGLGPMELAGQPEISVTTTSGEARESKVACIVQGDLQPSVKGEGDAANREEMTFEAYTMWCSEPVPNGWASVEITFPFEVELSQAVIHSQHGGEFHAAEAVRIAAKIGGGFRDIIEKPLASADAAVAMPPTSARTWQFHFKAGKSSRVVIRGLQFFSGDQEVFPPLVPSSIPHSSK